MMSSNTPITVDARHLEPPEPMDRALAAAGLLRNGQHVRMLLHREPFPLYSILDAMGLTYRTQLTPEGDFVILFAHDAEDLPI